ncbi:MAG TPA: hypothetical protein DCY93_02965 [Firmicutes bacterium]|nr:hypothetical protein [Bacillota bacterium]
MGKKLEATVMETANEKSLVCVKDVYYIVRGTFERGTLISFDAEDALAMPSYLFAIAALNEENLDSTFDFIRSNWFGGCQ